MTYKETVARQRYPASSGGC